MLYTFETARLPDVNMLGHSVCGGDWKLHSRVIQEYELVFMYQGEATFIINNSEYKLISGESLLIPPNVVNSGFSSLENPCRFYYVHFIPAAPIVEISEEEASHQIHGSSQDVITKLDGFFMTMPESSFQQVYFPVKLELKQYRDEIFTCFEKAMAERNLLTLNSKLMISLYFGQILVLLTRLTIEMLSMDTLISQRGVLPALLHEAIFYIHENYMRAMQVKDISEYLKISPQHLIRLFQKNLAKSPLQYINQLRTSKAKDLIRESSLTMKEICYAVGLENPHYFSRLFKKTEGIYPSEYKRKLDSKSNE